MINASLKVVVFLVSSLVYSFYFILDCALERSNFQIGNEEGGSANDNRAEGDQPVDHERSILSRLSCCMWESVRRL